MLLAIDMGNTHIVIGVLDGEKLIASERIATDRRKTDTEYAVLLHTILAIRKLDVASITGAILSSVVPPLTGVLKNAVRMVTGIAPLVVGPGVRNGLKIGIDDPKTVGADLIVAAVGAIEQYGAPLIVIDMGTATTFSSIDKTGTFRGGAIMPGVNVSLEGLVSGTSQLPRIPFETPGKAIGTNTIDCMQSGIIFGQAAMIDGMIDRIAAEMDGNPTVVATGGLAKCIIPCCSHQVLLDDELMIKGLRRIYEKNRK